MFGMVDITAKETMVDHMLDVGLCHGVVGELISRTLKRWINLSNDPFAAASQVPLSMIDDNVDGTFNK